MDEAPQPNVIKITKYFLPLLSAKYPPINFPNPTTIADKEPIKPIINGTGFYFVEAETRKSNRMDIVITYNKKKYVVELKIWRGGKYEQEGKEQLFEYLEAQNLDKGYMVFYNFNKNKEYLIDRTNINGKEIFEVIV